MDIKTKFSIGDEVWKDSSDPCEDTIERIQITATKNVFTTGYKLVVKYWLSRQEYSDSGYTEHELFKTKAECEKFRV